MSPTHLAATTPPALISAEALVALLVSPAGSHAAMPVVLDATAALPGQDFDPEQGFLAAHLPGALRFDIEAMSDPVSTLPHMLPTQAVLAAKVGALGVARDTRVVVYDQRGLAGAARCWWMLGLLGLDDVRVLDGGLPAWRAEGGRVEAGPARVPVPVALEAAWRARRVVALGDLRDAIRDERGMRVLDARSAGRFAGTAPEPRAGLRPGHIPGAVSLPFTDLLADPARLLPVPRLRAIFAGHGAMQGEVVASCGSGMTAAVISLARVVAGLEQGALYDGSWAEWGARADLPVATGPGVDDPAIAGAAR